MNATKQTMTDDFGHECAEVRVLPYGGGGNILCGRRGYEKEMTFRRGRIAEGVPFDLPTWKSLAVYFPEAPEPECPRCGVARSVQIPGNARQCLNCHVEWNYTKGGAL